jgi:hypothetical protein
MLAVFIVVGIGVIALSPETAQARPVSLTSMRPLMAVPSAARRDFAATHWSESGG